MATKPKSSKTKAPSMTDALADVLADTYVLAVKTHGYHWNVTGRGFFAMHSALGKLYEDLFEAADVLAERIRMLGSVPPSSMKSFLAVTALSEASDKTVDVEAVIKDLLKSNNVLRQRLGSAAELADELDDDVTEGILLERMTEHDKIIWMLESHLA